VTPRTERGRRTRTALLEAARSAFEQRGFDDCRMNDIADAAGVSHGTVYTYFESKEEILGQVIDELLVELHDDLRTPASDPVDRIEQANRRYLQAYRDNSRLLQVIEQAAVTNPELGNRLDEFRLRYHGRVTTALRRLQEQGRVTADLPADVAATALCAMVEGFSRYWQRPLTDDVNATLTRLWVAALGLGTNG
jgi:AcrR family transcriptional regulator